MLTVLGEAERFGAVFTNGAEVVELISDEGRAAGVLCTDGDSGESFEVRAANVVNATGVWADRIRPEEILAEEEVPRIAPSRGTHITIPTEKLPLTGAACIVPAGEERTIFALPWYGRALIGTTDRDYDGDIGQRPTVGRGRRLPAGGGQLVLRAGAGAGGHQRRVRGRAAPDLHRRSPQVG